MRPPLTDGLDDDLGNQFTETQVADAFDLIVGFCAVHGEPEGREWPRRAHQQTLRQAPVARS